MAVIYPCGYVDVAVEPIPYEPVLNTLIERLRRRGDSVQYEMQRMTAAGGWKNFHDTGDTRAVFDRPPDPPSFGPKSGYPEGRYRCVKRVDGRIEEVLWTEDSPAADAYYEKQRARTKQRERLEEMSIEELQETIDDPDSFDALEPHEPLVAMVEKLREDQNDREIGDAFEQWLLNQTQSGSLDDATLAKAEELTELKTTLTAASNRACYRCYSTKKVHDCRTCGDLVCEQHLDPQSGICHQCLESNSGVS